MRLNSRCSVVPMTSTTTIFSCILKIPMLGIFGPLVTGAQTTRSGATGHTHQPPRTINSHKKQLYNFISFSKIILKNCTKANSHIYKEILNKESKTSFCFCCVYRPPGLKHKPQFPHERFKLTRK